MRQDIDAALRNWEYEPGTIQARVIEASDGREVLQMRVDLGILQLEKLNRPDGTRPHGHPTYFDYLKQSARLDEPFVLNSDQCEAADREFVQFYHRRICWLALQNYARAMADADHTLAFMDFVRDHSPSEEFTRAHEQYRGFVLFQRTQAAAALKLDRDDPEGAIDAVHEGMEKIRSFLEEMAFEENLDENPMIQHLQKIEQSVRDQHNISETIQEQLARAVENEQYEEAARLRDVLRKRQ